VHPEDVRSGPAEDGKEHYGGWTMCSEGVRKGAVVYSFGIGSDVSFDYAVLRRGPRYSFRQGPGGPLSPLAKSAPRRAAVYPPSSSPGLSSFYSRNVRRQEQRAELQRSALHTTHEPLPPAVLLQLKAAKLVGQACAVQYKV